MLVLTRKPREEIRIGNGITITILRVRGQAVRVGIDAPNDIRIVRGELKPQDEVATESAAETETSPQVPSAIEGTSPTKGSPRAKADSATVKTAKRNRCERTTSLHGNDAATNASCSSRLSNPRRNASTLKSLVARNRAASSAANTGPPE